jgi:hypothetical protein
MPYRDMSDVSLATFYSYYGNYDWSLDYIAADYAEMTRNWVANWMHPNYARARWDMGIILGQYYYDEDFDYSSLPCTPYIGTWSRSYDLTLDPGPFVVANPVGSYGDLRGDWVEGEGFTGKYREAGGDFAYAGYFGGCWWTASGGDTRVTHMQVWLAGVDYVGAAPFRGHYILNYTGGAASAVYTDEGALITFSRNWNGTSEANMLGAAFQYSASPDQRIVRIDMSGTGTAPA